MNTEPNGATAMSEPRPDATEPKRHPEGDTTMTDDHQGARGDDRKTTAQGVPGVTLTDEERESLVRSIEEAIHWGDQEADEDAWVTTVEHIIAARIEQAEARYDALVAKVEALADEWERNYASMLVGGFSGCSIGADTAAKRLRALLSDDAGMSAERACPDYKPPATTEGGPA